MGLHFLDNRRYRRLSEKCSLCAARRGQPCSDGIDGSKPEDYECVKRDCHRLYCTPAEALACNHKIEEKNEQRKTK